MKKSLEISRNELMQIIRDRIGGLPEDVVIRVNCENSVVVDTQLESISIITDVDVPEKK